MILIRVVQGNLVIEMELQVLYDDNNWWEILQ